MRKIIILLISLALVSCIGYAVFAAEHAGKEHGGTSMSAPSASDIHKAMTDYITEKSEATGSFNVYDAEAKKERRLSLMRIHERVGKTGKNYYSCADFRDMDSQETLDLDLDVRDMGTKLKVVDVMIHKVNGKERYTYDKDDNRVPVDNMVK